MSQIDTTTARSALPTDMHTKIPVPGRASHSVYRSKDDTFKLSQGGYEPRRYSLDRAAIRELAELAGFEVREPETKTEEGR